MRLEAGSTKGNTNWENYPNKGVKVHVDTHINFGEVTPIYFASIGGAGCHWHLTGGNAIYNPTPTGFDIYLDDPYNDNLPINVNTATTYNWFINWFAIVP